MLQFGQLHATIRLPIFSAQIQQMPRDCPPHVPIRCFANIDTDNFSSEAMRDEVIAALAVAVDALDAELRYEAWRRAAIANGRLSLHPVNFEVEERVGRLRYRDNYESELADVLRSDALLGGADESDIEELIKWLFAEPSSIDQDAAEFLFEAILADKPIETGEGWYFRNPKRSPTPFDQGDPSCLPWRLGLKDVRLGSKYVGFNVDWRGLENPRIATFVEVLWQNHERWQPNGTSHPLGGMPAGCDPTGLEEFVARPPIFRAVAVPTTRVISR